LEVNYASHDAGWGKEGSDKETLAQQNSNSLRAQMKAAQAHAHFEKHAYAHTQHLHTRMQACSHTCVPEVKTTTI